MSPVRMAILSVLATLLLSIGAAAGASAIAHAASSCGSEDSPTWVWSKCGNLKRGVILRDGTTRVVGPCAFRRAWEGDSIDWTRTASLRGDYFARTHGCTVRPHA